MVQTLEGVTFGPNQFYDTIQFLTTGKKMVSVTGGINWFVLTRNRPHKEVRIHMRRKGKRMVPFSFTGVMIGFPAVGATEQIPVSGDTTNIPHVSVTCDIRYNEWNENFNHRKI